MTITDAAEQVLFGKTLEEKLTVASASLLDTGKKQAILSPDTPTRPVELQLSENGVRSQFPGVNKLDQDQPRGELLHFLANHELLASELMALVLLKFPDAPEQYRRGVYDAMREEQMHTLMYMRRMKECGLELGQLPLNNYFWRLVSPMKSPMEFVTKLNLTFEQANLDFSYHYAQLFEQVGDMSTANVLHKIYQDEIGHVGHGMHWLREWKKPNQSDWEAYTDSLTLPFSASKAKGMAPYNPAGRKAAGIDEDFIEKLSVYSQSRGRNPVLHWFNANAESAALAYTRTNDYSPSAREIAIEQDLELLMIAACKKDDMLMLRKKPSTEHLKRLQTSGLEIPELSKFDDPSLQHRKLGGIVPWAWSPDASQLLEQYKSQVPASVTNQWRTALPPQHFSKELGLALSHQLAQDSDRVTATSIDNAKQILQNSNRDLRLKAPYACSGRGQYRYKKEHFHSASLQKFLAHVFSEQKCIIIEPERDKVIDFSIHYDSHPASPARLRGFCQIQNTASGQFVSACASQKWTSLLPAGIPEFLFTQTNFKTLYHEQMPKLLAQAIPNYTGPIGIDAMIYRDQSGKLQLEPIVEINARYTMGRLALNLQRQLNAHQTTLGIQPKGTALPQDCIPFNDPTQACVLQVYFKYC